MKIKILKDILSFKVGDIFCDDSSSALDYAFLLIQEGYAEKVKEEIDIEKIRSESFRWILKKGPGESDLLLSTKEIKWFTAFRFVKAVIDTLNNGWTVNWETKSSHIFGYLIRYNHQDFEFLPFNFNTPSQGFLLPYMKDGETARKVIDFCGPELKILFNIN